MNQTPYRAIFFDLDGTLLPMDLDEFMGRYMKTIGAFAVSHGMDIEAFKKGLGAGIEAMARHEDTRSNAEVFWDTFFAIVPDSRETWMPLFEEFYENHFGAIGEGVESTPYAAESLQTLKKKGYPLVLATMPMFPLRAVEHRCAWADINPQVFERITNFENSRSVKPKLAYFEESLKAGELLPEEVLMVGNNTREDLACLKLGMDAYVITDHLINPNDFDLNEVKHGTFEQFATWAQDLPLCANPPKHFVTGLI